MRLIDGDALIEAIDKLPTTPLCHDMQKEAIIWEILNAPTVATDTNVPGKLTDEAAIEHLQASGWMQNHDREMSRAPWVSVKERLPEEGQTVLVYSKFGHVSDMTLNRYKGQNGYDMLIFDTYGMKPGTDIKYWMPLPESPEEDPYGSGAV